MLSHEPPWLPRALQVLDVRRDDRLLLCLPGSDEVAISVHSALSREGRLTVLEPRREAAAAIAKSLPEASVALTDIDAGLQVGTFDAVLVLPFAPRPRDPATWAEFIQRNLRPGGRFCIDLPAPEPMPDVIEAALEGNLACTARIQETFTGPTAEDLADALKKRGVRRAETLLGAHLVAFGSPFEVSDLLAHELRLPADEAFELGSSLSRRLRSTAGVELRVLRSAVAGMR